MNVPCALCAAGAGGDTGHGDLDFHMAGPYPGHHIFKCRGCEERWIRHHGLTERFGWTRYGEQFPTWRKPTQPVRVSKGVA